MTVMSLPVAALGLAVGLAAAMWSDSRHHRPTHAWSFSLATLVAVAGWLVLALLYMEGVR